MIEFEDEDFESLLFNVMKSGGNVLDNFPSLLKYEEFKDIKGKINEAKSQLKSLKLIDKPNKEQERQITYYSNCLVDKNTDEFIDKCLRYIILFYDKNTPLKSKKDISSNIQEKVKTSKVQAAMLAGFEVKHNKFDNDVNKLMNCINPIFNKIMLRYARFFNDMEWLTYTVLTEALLKEFDKLLSEDEMLKSNAMKNINDIRTTRKEIEEMLFNDDTNKNLSKDNFAYIEEASLKYLTPEGIADNIYNNKDPLFFV